MIFDKNYFKKFLLIDALFEGGRMFMGATSVTYLLSRGVSMGEIASLKSLQATVLILGEVPTGVFADSFGRRLSLVFAALAGMIGFLIYFLSNNIGWFLIAEGLTAISLCFWSGAFESCAIDHIGMSGSDTALNKFFHLNASTNNLTVLVLGFLGGWIGSKGINLPYLGALACYFFMLILLLNLPETHLAVQSQLVKTHWLLNIKQHFIAAFKQGILHPALFPFFLVNIGIQFVIQPILHYWQPFFSTIEPNIDSFFHGIVFSAYCGVTAILSYSYSKFSYKSFVTKPLTIAILFLFFSSIYLFLSSQKNLSMALVYFAFLQGFLSLCRTSLGVNMNKEIESNSRASILSSLSLFSRMGMITALFFISKNLNEKKLDVPQLYYIFGLISFVLIGLIILGIMLRGKNNAVQTP